MLVLRVSAMTLGVAAGVFVLRQPAVGFAYCPVSVDAVQALQFSATEPYRRAFDRRFGVELKSDDLSTASVQLSMVASGAIYRTSISDVTFNGGSAIAFFSFERPKAVDYVWVSRVTRAQQDVNCPLDAFRASHEYFNDRSLTRGELASRRAANERILAAAKSAQMSQPQVVAQIHRDCAEPDQNATLNHEVTPDGGDLRSLKGPTPVVALVHVSPNGQPLDVQLVQSSAFPHLNNAVLTSAQQSTYNPATIDCMPATGIYLFKAIFGT